MNNKLAFTVYCLTTLSFAYPPPLPLATTKPAARPTGSRQGGEGKQSHRILSLSIRTISLDTCTGWY